MISFNDTYQRGVRAKYEHKHTQDHDNTVFKESEQRDATVTLWRQSKDMNKDWKDNSESCAADGADERNEVIQLRYTDRQDTCNEIKHKSQIWKH